MSSKALKQKNRFLYDQPTWKDTVNVEKHMQYIKILLFMNTTSYDKSGVT